MLDDHSREGLGIELDFSLPADRVIRALDQIFEWRGQPLMIRCDNGPENIARTVQDWAKRRGIHLAYIRPGKPQQNAYIERYNRTVDHYFGEDYLSGTTQWFDLLGEEPINRDSRAANWSHHRK